MRFNQFSGVKLSAITISFICALATFANGQSLKLSPIEKAKMYPPAMLSNDQNELNLSAIKWQSEQHQTLFEEYRAGRADLDMQIDKLNAEIDALNGTLPGEVRLLDSKVRSELIGRVMEQLLMAKLDLATQSAEIEMLQSKLEDDSLKSMVANSKVAGREIAILAAQKKLEVAQIEYEKTKRLAASGSKSASELQMAKYTAEISKLELEKAKRDNAVVKAQAKVASANTLVANRVEVQPLKARIVAAEKFLENFSDGAKTMAKIEKLKNAVGLLEKDRQIYATELSRLGRVSHELDLLSRRISKVMGKKEEK